LTPRTRILESGATETVISTDDFIALYSSALESHNMSDSFTPLSGPRQTVWRPRASMFGILPTHPCGITSLGLFYASQILRLGHSNWHMGIAHWILGMESRL
jgi:hypothetical protein